MLFRSPGYVYENWFGLFAPIKTHRSIISRLNAEIVSILSEPGFRKSINDGVARGLMESGLDFVSGAPEDFAVQVRGDYDRLSKLVPTLNLPYLTE